MSNDERNKSAVDFIIVPATFVSKNFSCNVGHWKYDLLSDDVPISAFRLSAVQLLRNCELTLFKSNTQM